MPGRYKPVRLDAMTHETPTDILTDVIRIETVLVEKVKALLEGLKTQ